MSIMDYNGGALIGMKGKDCVAIATDKRFGIQAQTVSLDFTKVFQINPHTYMGFPGLATDIFTVYEKIMFRKRLYELKENRKISPKALASLVSNLLYENRFSPFFVEPMIVALDEETLEPYMCDMDLIGCVNKSDNFVVGGTSSSQLYGLCEALWEPDMEEDQLFETISQALVSACNRDAISGWGAKVYIIKKDKIIVRDIKTRMD
ncbi:proteasome subunit beta type-3-like [Myzus persicae]|uniref:proteasome subunit beta type-3-like n=1 Tax=Myzus persicae TaxID=13164 RepID=UPI000B938293|nr:proteasome subunit beta type-3-like [Myzus persicae]